MGRNATGVPGRTPSTRAVCRTSAAPRSGSSVVFRTSANLFGDRGYSRIHVGKLFSRQLVIDRLAGRHVQVPHDADLGQAGNDPAVQIGLPPTHSVPI